MLTGPQPMWPGTFVTTTAVLAATFEGRNRTGGVVARTVREQHALLARVFWIGRWRWPSVAARARLAPHVWRHARVSRRSSAAACKQNDFPNQLGVFTGLLGIPAALFGIPMLLGLLPWSKEQARYETYDLMLRKWSKNKGLPIYEVEEDNKRDRRDQALSPVLAEER